MEHADLAPGIGFLGNLKLSHNDYGSCCEGVENVKPTQAYKRHGYK